MDLFKYDAKLNYITKSDGSVFLEINESKIVSSINGPIEVKIQNELADKAYVSVSYKSLSSQSGIREKSIEAHLRGILDGVILTNLHPRTAINVNIQEVQNYGSYISCALNSCCLALLDASIPLKYTFASVTIGFIKESHEILYFPDIEQEKKCDILMTLAFDSIHQDLIFIDTNGIHNKKLFNYLLDNAKAYSKCLFEIFRKVMMNKYSKFLS